LRGQAELNHVGSRCTGKERDAESGNDYFEARYYSSAMGRFMSPDWASKEEPVPYAQMDNPQSLNLYSYVWNNPMDRIDPDGHWTCTGDNAKGDACQAMSAIHAKEGLVADGVDGLALLAADREAMTQGPKDHFVTVMNYPDAAGGYGHDGIGVGKTDNTQGYSTADPDTPKWERIIGAPKAAMEDDIKHHTNEQTKEVARHIPHYIAITGAQANAIDAAIRAAGSSGGRYNLIFNNCALKVESILHAGAVRGIPHGDIFPNRLIRAIDRISQ
jgi:RHS repeat-associated protein